MRELKSAFTGIGDVRAGLQAAIALELATVPPYLYALWSIKDARSKVADLIRRVVIEEMLHMALAANVLNAVGGKPSFTDRQTVPVYPTVLPGHVEADLKVRLRRCDRAQLTLFKAIERPEDPVEVQKVRAAGAAVTIGQFYDGITRALAEAGPDVFSGDPGRQLRHWPGRGEIRAVTDLASAQWAIRLIKEQGEGSSPHDPTDREGDLAHYYRFWEILEGKEIVRHGRGWAFGGSPIPAPEVLPLVDDPAVADLPPGSLARTRAEAFNQAYAATLRALERTFNGDPAYLTEALGLMYSLRVLAVDLFAYDSGRGDGTVAAPTFELPRG